MSAFDFFETALSFTRRLFDFTDVGMLPVLYNLDKVFFNLLFFQKCQKSSLFEKEEPVYVTVSVHVLCQLSFSCQKFSEHYLKKGIYLNGILFSLAKQIEHRYLGTQK